MKHHYTVVKSLHVGEGGPSHWNRLVAGLSFSFVAAATRAAALEFSSVRRPNKLLAESTGICIFCLFCSTPRQSSLLNSVDLRPLEAHRMEDECE